MADDPELAHGYPNMRRLVIRVLQNRGTSPLQNAGRSRLNHHILFEFGDCAHACTRHRPCALSILVRSWSWQACPVRPSNALTHDEVYLQHHSRRRQGDGARAAEVSSTFVRAAAAGTRCTGALCWAYPASPAPHTPHLPLLALHEQSCCACAAHCRHPEGELNARGRQVAAPAA